MVAVEIGQVDALFGCGAHGVSGCVDVGAKLVDRVRDGMTGIRLVQNINFAWLANQAKRRIMLDAINLYINIISPHIFRIDMIR